ncbi:predicted protein [Sclerotinia sclerotiorum 1980 UF-70]|uniref:Uncharacterized protein n=1 Tax=Sclerotinia sclerotiorum (strain ATCC 18683 / 1980 / Ss-1) TaxID=665079 RepID=A7F4B9_SCLS1|nr:predicted protein [Sclerotinia sclerotiorum 1980 UF-70]EDN97590.1 predicted protein [Sclerotinia sclerotiorum 1980 UF-70]
MFLPTRISKDNQWRQQLDSLPKRQKQKPDRAKREAKRAEQARTGLKIKLSLGSRQKKAASPAPKISSIKQKALAKAEDPTVTNEVEEEIDEWDIPASYVLARTPEWKPLKLKFDFSAKKISGGR